MINTSSKDPWKSIKPKPVPPKQDPYHDPRGIPYPPPWHPSYPNPWHPNNPRNPANNPFRR